MVGKSGSGKKPRLSVMAVTQDKALEWLEHANVVNRRISQTYIDKLIRDMRVGEYHFTGDGPKFDTNGVLIDGQHRLLAIAQSGLEVEMPVWFDLDPNVRAVIDTNRTRDLVASMLFDKNLRVTQRMGQACKAMSDPKWKSKASRQQDIDFFMRHLEALRWACSLHPKNIKRVSKSQLFAVLARAWYTHPKGRLEEFAAILADETRANGPDDSAAVRLRRAMIYNDTTATESRRALYASIEWSLDRFLKRRPTQRINMANQELFLLPEEDGFEATRVTKMRANGGLAIAS